MQNRLLDELDTRSLGRNPVDGKWKDLRAGAGKSLRDASFGLHLRYEVRREFTPYIGVEWHKAYGNRHMP